MAKLLNGKELSLFIKEQQAKEVRSLKQSKKINPKLVIIRTNPNPITDTYVKLKVNYGDDIGVAVEVIDCDEADVNGVIGQCNNNPEVTGIIIQLPLVNKENTNQVVNLVDVKKDVDGLSEGSGFDPATPTAINWLLAGYNIDLLGKKVVVVGGGRLVGLPLQKMWLASGYDVSLVTSKTENGAELIASADILVSATGKPGLITSDLIKSGAAVIDAGVATDANGLVGDVAEDARERDDIKITPVKGGVGPLTVAALFHNVLIAARSTSI